ncbi:hypothetical protein OSB04_003383 [Centaurea solstitialis]|uniref:NAC domain-containing protein n=1 Tax=Centaurea solstitialis TaxID=347529 RepID=A0AA38UC01_9ASTR|nr:hypothetical protein OSB04_003383 [Centaurea solstitialis]
MITGLRKTLQFYEGQAPNGQKTNWMMQEYTTTDKYSDKREQDRRALCRVFLADDKGGSGKLSESELLEKNMEGGTGPSATADTAPDPPSAMADTSPDPPAVADTAVADTSPDQPSAVANRSPDWPPENIPDREYVLMGDYLELDDLADSLSHSSRSAESSCMTMTMTSEEEYFDPDALLRELGDDIVDQQVQDSSVKLNLSAPPKSKEVVMSPTTLGFCDDGKECKPSTTQTSITENEPGDDKKESTSNGINTTASSSSSSSSEEKKDRGGRTKKRKVMKYLCFLAF